MFFVCYFWNEDARASCIKIKNRKIEKLHLYVDEK